MGIGFVVAGPVQRAYITVLCEALGTSYGNVAVSVIVPTALLRRHASSPLLSKHGGRSPAVVYILVLV